MKKIFLTTLFLISFIFPGITLSQVYDDFSGDRMDPTRWAVRELGRRIDTDTGKLKMVHFNPHPSSVTLPYTSYVTLPFPNPNSINSIQADVVLDESSTTNNGYVRAELAGHWYNDGTAGTGSVGDITAGVSLRNESGNVIRARWYYARCSNADCTTTDTGTTQTFTTPVNNGTPYTLYIAYDSVANQFAFRIGPEQVTYTAPLARAGLSRVPMKELRAREQIDDATSLAAVSATFDNVYLNDAIRPLMAPVLLAPVGLAGDVTEVSWRAVPNATYYQFYVGDSVGNAFTRWYTNTEVACPTFPGTCTLIPPELDLECPCTWYVRTYGPGSYGLGPWSKGETLESEEPDAGGPAAATLVSPTGTIFKATPTFTWNEVSGAMWYYLWVNDSSSTGGKIRQWFNAAAVCSAGTCSVTPTTPLAQGACRWWVQAWGMAGYGTPSSPMSFRVSPPVGAVLISPSGATTATPTYTWNAVLGAAWYYLEVSDASKRGKIGQWYSATQAGCPAGTGTCSVTPATALASGPGTWGVTNWGPLGYGPWSSTLSFTVP